MEYHDRVKDTTTTTGTGTITLSGTPPTGYVSFGSRYSTGHLVPYCIVLDAEWEVGRGTMASSTTLERTQVFESSNSDTLVNFSAGTKEVFVTAAAYKLRRYASAGQTLAASLGNALP